MTDRRTRHVILDVARQLFTERGFTSTTIRDIAERAGVSPALVMKLTGSKAQLFEAAVPDAPNVGEPDQSAEPLGYRMARALAQGRRRSGYVPAVGCAAHRAVCRKRARQEHVRL